MGRKCSVFNCKVGFAGNSEKFHVFQFPKDLNKRQLWLNSLPNKFNHPITENMGVCRKHWPDDCLFEKPPRSKYEVPVSPPSVFPGCHNSNLRQTAPKADRNVEKRNLSLTKRNEQPDELDVYNQVDKIINFESFQTLLSERLVLIFCES